MKESLAHALASSLEWDDCEHERAIDKLTAFSSGPRLGTLLWRLKYHNCHESFTPAVYILASKLKPINKRIAIKIAEQALFEWLLPFCTRCLGSKQIQGVEDRDGTKSVLVCPDCHGTGLRMYTDTEREDAVGMKSSKQISMLLNLIGTYDKNVQGHMMIKLGRVP